MVNRSISLSSLRCLFGMSYLTLTGFCGTLAASPLQLDVVVESSHDQLICTASVKNISDHEVELASIREPRTRLAAFFRANDTYWSKSDPITQDGGGWSVYYGYAFFKGKEPRLFSLVPREIFKQILHDPAYVFVTLQPRATRELLMRNLVPEKPPLVILQFLVKSGDKFRIEEVQWSAK